MKIHRLLVAGLGLARILTAAPLEPSDLTRAAEPLLASQALQALSLGVVQPGGTVRVHAGRLAPYRPVPPDDRTLYEIGSLTKVFTGLLLADAVVRGEVTLDQPIARLLPADVVLPDEAGERITLRMLSTHTSGLPRIPAEILADDFRDPYARYGEAELWGTLRRVRLDAEPGTRAAYSNLGAGLLGTLLARRAGVDYATLLTERVLRPLGLANTAVKLTGERRDRFAPPFANDGRPWTPWEFEALAGAGGLRSTLPDLLRLAEVLLQPAGSPLQAAIELAWAKQVVAAPLSEGGQGLGWMIAGDGVTRWHNGMTGGFHAAIFINRESRVAVVALANRAQPAVTPLAAGLLRRAAGAPERAAPNAARAEVMLTPEQVDRCVGTYRVNAGLALVCERRDAALFVTPTGRPADRLAAASATTFFSRRADVGLVFELPAGGGPATAVTLTQRGRSVTAQRE